MTLLLLHGLGKGLRLSGLLSLIIGSHVGLRLRLRHLPGVRVKKLLEGRLRLGLDQVSWVRLLVSINGARLNFAKITPDRMIEIL